MIGNRLAVATFLPYTLAESMWELAMRMYAEIIDGAGSVVARAEDDVSQNGDLTVLVQLALDQFQELHPDQSFLTEVGQAGFTVQFGKAEIIN